MKNNSVAEKTIKGNLCIGCGICSSVCPVDAIKMEKCDENYLRPVIDVDKCINCGICAKFCPHTFEKVKEEAQKVTDYKNFNEFGIKDAKYYVAYVNDNEKRIKSASGGIATYVAEWLFKNKKIDLVIHAKMIEGKTGEQHYKTCISRNIEELNQNRRSFYCALSFDEPLRELKKCKDNIKVLIMGTPCVVRGIRNLIENNKQYSNVERIYTVALSCSHNVNGLFTDYLADSLNIDKNEIYKVDLRNKDNIEDANNFNNHYFNNKGSLNKINRFKSEFTQQWRNYSFSMNVCNACSDFWGYTADISVKDAWGKWAKDPLGESIVILRNRELDTIFQNNKELHVEEETKDTIIKSQKETVIFKQYYAKKRTNINNAKRLNKISFIHRINSYMRNESIKKYKKMQIKGYNKSIKNKAKFISFIKRIYNKVIRIWRKITKWELKTN